MPERIGLVALVSLFTCALPGCSDSTSASGEGAPADSSSGGETSGPSSTTVAATGAVASSTSGVASSTSTGADTSSTGAGTTSTGPHATTTTTTGASSTGVVEREVSIARIGRYAPPDPAAAFDEGIAEIAAFDPGTGRLFVTNGQTGDIDILDLSDPTSPTWVDSFRPASAELDEPTSVAVFGSVVAATFPGPSTTALGAVVFFDAEGTELASVTVGVSPEMLTFTPDGSRVVVANEAPPQGYLGGQDDPTGSVSIIDVSGDIAALTDDAVTDVGFGALTEADIDETTRVFGPGASVAQDLEPEHIAVSADGNTAWVTLQENNAIATIDLAGGTLLSVTGVGWVDHSVTGLDPSNEDGAVAIATHPVFGMRLPDSVGAFTVGGAPYIVTANEGGSRSYSGFDERERVVDLELDPAVFPNAVMLQALGMLGRLRVTSTLGDIDDDGDYDALYAYGSRSISVFDVTGAPSLVWDSGDAIEQAVAAAFPNDFNSDSDEDASFDSRSDDKGPEPEGLVVGDVFGAPYVFVALERMGGVMIWDLSDPTEPALFEYVNPRDFSGVPSEGTADDLGPEGLVFVAAEDSPTTNPLVVVCNEVSGTVSIYEMTLSVVP